MSKNIYQKTDGLLYTELNISKNIPIHLSWWVHPLADNSNSSNNLPAGLENIFPWGYMMQKSVLDFSFLHVEHEYLGKSFLLLI